MAVHPLRPATDRRLGGPLPRQQANQTRAHPAPPEFSAPLHAELCAYAVLAAVSGCCPPVRGRLPTRYSPVRHSVADPSPRRVPGKRFVRLACVRHAASVHPEPGSNSHYKFSLPCSRLAFTVFRLHSCLNALFLNSCPLSLTETLLNLSRLFHCSVIKVLCRCFRDSLLILPHFLKHVNNFFVLFCRSKCFAFVATSLNILPRIPKYVNTLF